MCSSDLPLEGNVVIEMASNLGYAIIDRLLGGSGNPLEKSREFSEIELVIIERILNVCTNLLREPWQNVLEIEPRLVRIETNSQFAQIISPQEMTALVTLNVRIANVEGLVNFCLPYIVLEDVIDRLNTKYWFSTLQAKDDKGYEEMIEVTIARAQIPVRAVLGQSVLSVNDFMNLQIGDVIRLNTKVEDELDVYVGNMKKFKALPGASSDLYAVRVTSIVREEE